MADAVNPTVIKLTQDTLGKHVSNPSLTTKLLNKPPFKFLHDVINAVITETGFLSGLYTEAELDKDNIKDKEGKISFLQKCIDATIFATGEDLTVRPSKIVSGHEADKTNEFLQALARAVESKTDSGEAVQKVLAGEKPSKSKASKDKPSKSSDKPKSVNGIRRTSGASKENLAPTAGQDKGNEPKSPRPPIPVIKINASALITDEGLESGRTESVLNGEVEDESEEVEEDPSVITEGAHENDEASSTIASESVKLMDDKKKPPVKNNSKTTKNPKNTNRLQGKPGASKSENSKPSVGRSLNTESNSRGADRRRGEVGAAENKRTSLKDRQAKASRKSDGKVVKRTSISQPPAPKSKVQGRAKDDKSRGKVGDGKDDKSIRSRGKVGDGKEDKKRTVRDKKPSKEDVDRGARKKDSKRGSRADKPSRPGKENAPPTVTAAAAVNNEDPPPTDGVDADAALAEDKAPDAETPEGEAPDGEAVQEDVPEGEAGDESIPDLGPGEGNVVGAVGGDGDEDVDLDDMEVQGQGDGEALQLAPDEAEGGGEDQGIGSGGPTSLVGRDVPLPPADAVDPAILKAMGGDGLLEPGGGDQGDPSEHPDSGVGSIDSPKSSSPAFDLPVTSPLDELPSSSPGPPKAESPSSSGLLAKAGPVKAVHPEGGNFGDPSPEPPTATTPGPPAGPSRPPSSLRNVSSRPMSSRASRPRTARPPSARPAAPRVRERRDVPAEDLVRPSTGVSPAVLSSLIVEGGRGPARPDGAADNLAADADDDFIVADTSTSLLPTDDPLNFGASSPTAIQGGLDMDLGGLPTSQDINDEDVGEGGLLMDQILDVKKNLEDGRKAAFSPETPGHRRVNMVTDGLSDAARRKEREAIQQDVNKLAGSIQTLTKAVNPLAKMLDYLQEDLDSMQKELNDWRDENKRLRQTLRSEQSNMAACIEPLTAQLLELDAAILEQQDRISVVKCSTLKNNDRIHSLLSAVSLGSD